MIRSTLALAVALVACVAADAAVLVVPALRPGLAPADLAARYATTSVVAGSVSANARSSINKLCGERIATSLQYGFFSPRLSPVTRATVALLNCSKCS